MRVLHISYWYPNKKNEKEALWIKEQLDALSQEADVYIFHFEIYNKNGLSFKRSKSKIKNQVLLSLPFQKWFLNEIICLLWLFYQLVIRRQHRNYDVINFHIAYPMLTYWHLIKKYIRKPVVISEHWSAYHFNFGVVKELPRIQKIFTQKIPIFTVSKALALDIKKFSKAEFSYHIVPNVVDNSLFYTAKLRGRQNFLFMLSQWKYPKTPLLVMKAFLQSEKQKGRILIIGGYGPQWKQMKDFVIENQAESRIKMVGKLSKNEIAGYMQKCHAFLHPTDYETFSVVCAEALSCGAYVIAPCVGGIPEVLQKDGWLLAENTQEAWLSALGNIPENYHINYQQQFDKNNIGKIYYQALQNVIDDFKR